MKNYILIFLIGFALLSCNPNSNDSKAKLDKLKTQRDQLETEISTLEKAANPDGASAAEEKIINVKIEELSKKPFNHYINIQGVVDADQNVAVSPQMGGIVKAVYVTEGNSVKKGQLLAEVDASVLKQSIEEIKTQLDLATTIFEKQKALWDKKIGSEVQFLQAKTGKESLEKRLKTTQEQLEMTKIVSPINGTVESVPLRVGQMASPGMPTSAIRIINMSVAKITADVSENYAAQIKNGDKAIVKFPDINKEIETKLSFTSRFIDPTNRTFRIECKVSSREVELRANMFATIKVNDYKNDSVISVPVNLIQNNSTGKFVFVAEQQNNKWMAIQKVVKTGLDYDGIIEVSSGLSVGDKLITSGFQGLNENDQIAF